MAALRITLVRARPCLALDAEASTPCFDATSILKAALQAEGDAWPSPYEANPEPFEAASHA